MWNTTFKEHAKFSQGCVGFLHWDMNKENIWGLGCREQMICTHCKYRSKFFCLHEEIVTNRRGRKAAKVNVGLAVGLSKTPIAAAGYRRLCLSTNLPPPSAKGIQKICNKVLPEVEKISKEDMKQRREQLKCLQNTSGKTNPNVIDVQSDGLYNNNLYSGVGKTPFQPATQVIYSMAENVTPKHDIIGLVVKNKLCSKGKHLKESDDHQCLGKNCTATIPFQQNIGDEKSWAKEILEDLKNTNEIEVRNITTDPDSGAYQAAQELYDEGITETSPTHQLDTRHVSKNHRLFIKKNKNLSTILKGKTVKVRTQMQNKLAIDLAERCHSEICQAFKKYGNDINKVRNKLTYAADAIVDCYQDWHLKCAKYSFVCKGLRKNNWISRSSVLDTKFGIKQTQKSSEVLRECVNYRMCPAMMEKTKLNSNTQKVEAFNKCLRTSVPKNVTFSRNTSGRAHSAAHSVNLGTANSIYNLCNELGCSISPESKVHKALTQLQKTTDMLKDYKKTMKSCVSRAERRAILYDLYERHQEEILYEKNMLLPVTKAKPSHDDHMYCRSSKKKKV